MCVFSHAPVQAQTTTYGQDLDAKGKKLLLLPCVASFKIIHIYKYILYHVFFNVDRLLPLWDKKLVSSHIH